MISSAFLKLFDMTGRATSFTLGVDTYVEIYSFEGPNVRSSDS